MSFLQNRKPAQTSATHAARPAGAGRYAGLRSDNRKPRLVRGDYVVEITSTRLHDGFNGKNFFLEGVVVGATDGSANRVGSEFHIQVSLKSAKAEMKGMSTIKRLCCVATQHETDAEFEAKYPTWEDLIDRALGFSLEEDVFGAEPLAGAKIRVTAFDSQTKAEDGTPYQNYSYSVYAE